MPKTVLLVDDHLAFRRCVRALLEADGFEVVGEAADGGAGLSAEQALHPDVVLVDVQLPDIDGFDVARRLTEGRNGAAPLVILTSSSDDPLYPERAVRHGARGFIAKHDLSGSALERLLD
jgi:DNA-binding NarL/FixJ family response regulator